MTIRRRSASTSATSPRRTARASPGPRRATGPLVVKAANWLTHLEYEWESPVWKHWIQFFSAQLPLRALRRARLRHERLARRRPVARSLGRRISSAVIDAARPDGPVTLLGISQGAATCIRYATRHPERVARMILYGGYARGRACGGTIAEAQAALPGDGRAGPRRLGQATTRRSARCSRRASFPAAPPSSCSGSTTCA